MNKCFCVYFVDVCYLAKGAKASHITAQAERFFFNEGPACSRVLLQHIGNSPTLRYLLWFHHGPKISPFSISVFALAQIRNITCPEFNPSSSELQIGTKKANLFGGSAYCSASFGLIK